MFETNTCATLIAREIARLYAFLNSDAGQLCFAVIATWRAIIYYCRRSRHPEAWDLASAMIAGGILAAVIMVHEVQLSGRVKQVLACKRSNIQVASLIHRSPPKEGDRNGLFLAHIVAPAAHRSAHLRLRERQIAHPAAQSAGYGIGDGGNRWALAAFPSAKEGRIGLVDEVYLDAVRNGIETHDRV